MKRIIKLTVLFPILSFLFVACKDSGKSGADQEIKPVFDLAAAKSAIEAVNADFGTLVSQGDSVGLANHYTTDAKLMGPNMPTASGRSSIQSAFGGMFTALGKLGLKLSTTEVWGNESMVSEEGTFTMTDKDGKEIDKGKYIVLWKMEDGKWKLFRDLWNSDNAPAPAAK